MNLFSLTEPEKLDRVAEIMEAAAAQKPAVQRVMLCGFLAAVPDDILTDCCVAVGRSVRQSATRRDTAAKSAKDKKVRAA